MQDKRLQSEIESENIRINQKGQGGKPKLEIKEEVCLCLFYLRKIPTFEVLGLHFGISKTEAKETEAKDTFHYWLEILGNVLPASLLEQVEKHDRIHRILTQNKRHETKSFPGRVFLLNTPLDF
ncbi:helix-turn-helix domain-containing protein [Trichormus azollae]|uniref:helix-turn-helix domain-containing protein n=1 Tax=Trichormus azollae TaxID=1164 RepID=UPI00325DD440